MKQVCFVCWANECRSPMAEKILKNMIKLENIKNIKVFSAGINATEGEEMTLKAKRALKNLGINAGKTKSKKLKTIKTNTIYVTMTQEQKNALGQKNVFSFKELVGGEDVEDPFSAPQEVYDQTAYQLKLYCGMLLQKLKKLN